MELVARYCPEKQENWELKTYYFFKNSSIGYALQSIENLTQIPEEKKNDSYYIWAFELRACLDQEKSTYDNAINNIFSAPGFLDYFQNNNCDVSIDEIKSKFGDKIAKSAMDLASPTRVIDKNYAVCNNRLFDTGLAYRYCVEINGEPLYFSVSPTDTTYPSRHGDYMCWWNWREDLQYLSEYLYMYLKDEFPINQYLDKALDKYAGALSCLEQSLGEDNLCFDRMERLILCLEQKKIIKRVLLSPDFACGQWVYRARNDDKIELCLVDKKKLVDALLGTDRAVSLQKEFELLLKTDDIPSSENYYVLMNKDNKPYISLQKGQLGGHRKLKIYGRLDCPSAAKYIAKGQYAKHRVFFADEQTAIAAGYRPCGVCMKEAYKKWKERNI